MESFYARLKKIFESIPNKTRFLTDLGLNSSYSGFRYFMHGRRSEPTTSLLETISEELGYEYVRIPVKKNEAGETLKKELRSSFLNDLENYTQKYSNDKARVYVKDTQGSAIHQMFEEQAKEEVIDLGEELKAADLF